MLNGFNSLWGERLGLYCSLSIDFKSKERSSTDLAKGPVTDKYVVFPL